MVKIVRAFYYYYLPTSTRAGIVYANVRFKRLLFVINAQISFAGFCRKFPQFAFFSDISNANRVFDRS